MNWLEFFERTKWFWFVILVLVVLWATGVLPQTPSEARQWIIDIMDRVGSLR